MKLTSPKIAAMVKSVLRGNKSPGAHNLINPQREWLIGVLTFIAMAIAAGWWATSLYVRFFDPSALMSGEVVTETATFRPAQVEAAIAALESRANRYEAAERTLRAGVQLQPVTLPAEPTPAATTSEPVVISDPSPTAEDDDTSEVLPVSIPDGLEVSDSITTEAQLAD